MELNICYTRFLSLMFEKLLGKDYVSNDLTLVKPHTITADSFQKLLAYDVPLTSHMLKVAKLSIEPEQPLIPPSGEVNTDDTTDKSPSRTSVQLVTQLKAPTDRMTKRRRIPPSSKPKSPYKVRVILPKKQVAETQHAKVTMATADATKSLASELAEEQENQPSTAEAEKDCSYLGLRKKNRLGEGSQCNYGVTCEDEAKRRNSRTKTRTFEEICYLLLYAVSNKEDMAYPRQLIPRIRDCSYLGVRKKNRDTLPVKVLSLGAARKWFTNECIDTISTWDDLFEKFIQKLYNLSDLHKDKETSDENNPNIIDNVPEIFKIEEDMFNFDKPLCIAFKEFNYLLKIDPDLFTYDIQWIKTYDEYEQELNNEKHKGLMDNGQRMGFRINLVTIYANCTASKMELQNGRHVFWMPTDIVMDRSYPGCLPDHMDHICEEVSSLNLKLRDKESFIIHQVSAKIKSSLPVLVTTTLQEQLPRLLSATLKDYLPSILQEPLQTHILTIDKFARLEMELSKTLKEVKDDLNFETKSLGKFWEHQSAETLVESQREQPADVKVANKESTPPASDNKPSEGKELVVYNSKKKKSEGIILVEDDSDEDDKFLPTPPKELTPPRYSSKGKAFAIIEEPGKEIRISDLKAEKEKSEQELRKLLNQVTLKAQAHKWTKHKAKKAKMMEEYNHQISYRADPLPITKISYVVNSRKEATIKITRGNNPLNLIVHPNFRLKTLGFSEWLEVHVAKRLGLPPPPKLATFRLTAEEKKRKRTEFIKEVFLTKDVRVDGMDKNLIPPHGVLPIQDMLLKESEFHLTPTTELIRLQKQIKVESEIAREMFSRMNYVIEARLSIGEPLSSGLSGEEDQLSAKHQLAVKGLSECKALESNIRRIQVKDIVKEVENYLKTYSSARMDIAEEQAELNVCSLKKAGILTSVYGGINIGLS
ncbi:hypothetical protein Tco_1191490 [Tanacetum coccineum]